MNTPQKPKDHPTSAKPGAPAHGVPDGAGQDEAKGVPNSDRNATETAVTERSSN